MTKLTPSLLTASLLALGLSTAPAHALNTRSFISANGVDTNACTRPAPCRTLQKAHDSTNPGGEINMLDPAGYGTVVITKAISIVNDGVGSAGILVPSGGNGITINAGVNDRINLRGLIIEGAGVGIRGILFNTGASLTIENSVVRNFTSSGIALAPNASSTLAVSNTLVADNSFFGIFLQPIGNGSVDAVFNRVEAYNNGLTGIGVFGNFSTGSVRAVAADCVVAKSRSLIDGSRGYLALTLAGQAVTVFRVFRSLASGYEAGVRAEGSAATALVSQSNLENTPNPFSQSTGGIVYSYGDNYSSGIPAPNVVSKH